MGSTNFKNVSFDEELQRAKWYKEDLDKGGWNEIHRSPAGIYWMKTFSDQEVPTKALCMLDIPIPAKKVMEMMNPSKLELRNKWDKAFLDHEILESFPDGSIVAANRLPVSKPLTQRSFVVYRIPFKSVDWYGKEAFVMIEKNAWHASKPAGADGMVRATNGGNFTVLIPEESDPDRACKMFGLRNNNYNGHLPNSGCIIRRIISKRLPAATNHFRECLIEGYSKYFKDLIVSNLETI